MLLIKYRVTADKKPHSVNGYVHYMENHFLKAQQLPRELEVILKCLLDYLALIYAMFAFF